jgi:hypothetical protein
MTKKRRTKRHFSAGKTAAKAASNNVPFYDGSPQPDSLSIVDHGWSVVALRSAAKCSSVLVRR